MVLIQPRLFFKSPYCYWFLLSLDSYFDHMSFRICKKMPSIVKAFDQGSILMVVYGAFSGAVVAGLWQEVSVGTLILLIIVCSVLLTIIMLLGLFLPRWLGFNRADQKTIFFCGSKKTLASGVPMAQILFIGQPLGMIVLPIMIFHQIQLMVCGIIANYWAKQSEIETKE